MAPGSSEPWSKISHIIPASHPRGYPRGVRDPQTSRLKLHVSQYIPQSASASPSTQAVTLILQHGMSPGDNHACLEPFLSDLLSVVNMPIRGVWMMEAVSCGKSFLLNKDEMGDEHHWFDSARDLLQMVNRFQDEMKPPIMGFGQSWGVVPLLVAASWSPLLFWGLVASEPVVENGYHQWKQWNMKEEEGMKINISAGLYRRQRVWANREEVRKWWTEGKGRYIGREYDPRVLDKIVENDYEDREDGRVELVTPPSQTVAYFVRPDPPISGMKEDARYERRTVEMRFPKGFWSPWNVETRECIRNVRCKVLYLWASQNAKTSPEYQQRLVSNTGTGTGGGGGREKDQIEQREVDGGHSLPLFVPIKIAEAIAPWMQKIWREWNEEQERRRKEPKIDPERLPEEFEIRLLSKPSKL